MNKINFKLLYILQILFGFIAVIPLFFSDPATEEVSIPSNMYWMPMLGYIVFIACVTLDYLSGRKPIARTVILILGLAIGLICLSDSFGLFIAVLIIFSFPYIIALIVAAVRDTSVTAKVKSTKTLPVGVISAKEQNILIITFLVVIAITAALTMLFINLYDKPALGLLVIPVIIPIVVIIVRKTNTNIKLLGIVNKEMNFEKFNDLLTETLKNNLHPETYNYLMIIKTNYLIAYDLEQAIELSKSLKEPTAKQFKTIYNSVIAEIYVNSKQFDKFHEIINNVPAVTQSALLNYEKVIATTDEMLNIESAFPVNLRLPFSNASSYEARMTYYHTRGNKEKAIEYAKIIKSYCPGLKEYVKKADLILSENSLYN